MAAASRSRREEIEHLVRVNLLGSVLVEPSERPQAGDVHQRVHVAEVRQGRLEEVLQVFVAADVGGHDQPTLPQPRVFQELVQAILAARREHQPRAARRQVAGNGFADAAARAGQDDHLV